MDSRAPQAISAPPEQAASRQTVSGGGKVPLVLDLDGTLLSTDLLYETFWAALAHRFLATLTVLFTSLTRPARLKERLSAIARPDIDTLPVTAPVLALARTAVTEGRAVHLASASDQSLVDAVGARFGLPGPHFGSSHGQNLKGEAKAALLADRFGAGGYDYAGDSRADLPAWEGARQIIAVAPPPALLDRIRATGKPVRVIDPERPRGAFLKELRPHQWVKNLLLLLPALAAHDFTAATLVPVLVAIMAFCIGASSIYIVNDLLDLGADRRHPEKRARPIAAGTLPIPRAMAASVGLSIAALALALAVSPAVAGLSALYMTGSLVYSLWLKKWRWIDVLALVGLFLLRVLTGGAAAQIAVSGWLLAFVFAVVLTLACVKRLTELARAFRRGQLPGRGYSRRDFRVLQGLAYGAAAVAAVVFVGYAFSPAAVSQYRLPHVLALAAAPVAVWLARMVRLACLGQEDYDPVKAVLRDRVGLAIALSGLAITFLAH